MSRVSNDWVFVGRLREYPETIGDLEALLDASGPHFDLSGWMWCRQCERAYPVGELRVMKSGPGWTYYEWALECATEHCASRRADWHPWHPDELPRAIHPDYPGIPEPFGHYPLGRL